MFRLCFKILNKIGFPVKSFLEKMAEVEAFISSKWAYYAHKRLLNAQSHFD